MQDLSETSFVPYGILMVLIILLDPAPAHELKCVNIFLQDHLYRCCAVIPEQSTHVTDCHGSSKDIYKLLPFLPKDEIKTLLGPKNDHSVFY